jgi:MFS family permease
MRFRARLKEKAMLQFFKKQFLAPYYGLPKQIYILFGARIINALGLFIHPLLTLIFTRKIGLGATEAGLYVALCGVLFGVSSILGGKLSDHMSRKKLIIICEGMAAISLMVSALLPVNMLMVYFIMLANAFLGLAEPSHNALVADVTEIHQRDKAYSLVYLGFNIGFIVGPALGSFLFEKHLKWLFIGDGLTLFIAVVLIAIFIKENDPISHLEVASEVTTKDSTLSILVKNPLLVLFALVLLGYNIVYSQWGFMMPLTIAGALEGGIQFYGLLASFNGLIVIVFTPLVTGHFEKMSSLKRIVIGGFLYTVGFGSFAFIVHPIAIFTAAFIFTMGEIFITISYMPYIISHSPVTHRGRMSAILPLIIGAGFTFGPMIMGPVVESFGLQRSWVFIGIFMLFNTCLMGGLLRIETKQMR